MQKLLMGIDIGTTSVKTAVFNADLEQKISLTADYTLDSHGDIVEFDSEQYWTIVKGEMPAHFKHISPLQYAILWPRACQDYAVNYKSALLLNHPEYKQNPEKFWFDRLKGRHGAGMAWEYYIDPIFAKVLPLWRLGDKDVKGYIPDHKKK